MNNLTVSERRWILVGAMTLAFSAFLFLLSLLHPGAWAGTAPVPSEDMELLDQAFQAIRENYVTVPEDRELIFEAIRGMVDHLDLYSTFYDTRQAERFTEETEGAYGGLGVGILRYQKALTVQYMFPESPLIELGVQPGDRIVEVEGEEIPSLDSDAAMDAVVSDIKGPAGSDITITIESREASERREVTVQRVRVGTTSIHGVRMLDPENKVGYIRLDSFQNNSVEDFDKAVDSLLAQGMESLVFDLRQNTGGVLRVAVELADRFLEKGVKITSTQGRAPGADREFFSRTKPRVPPSVALAVLIDSRSASASEVVAGAIKDHQRGILVGERSFGKGLVQSVLPLGEGEAILKITSGRYYTPANHCIQSDMNEDGRPIKGTGGIAPDFYAMLEPEEKTKTNMRRAIERMESHTVEGGEIFAPEDIKNGVHAWRVAVADFEDPQIRVALDVLAGRPVASPIPVPAEERTPPTRDEEPE